MKMRKNKLIDQLARKDNVIYFDEAVKITDLSRESLRVVFNRLEKSGVLERIEKGKYLIIPIGAEKGKYTLNEFVIGSTLLNKNNYSIGYWSALHHHGLTEQIPNIVFIQTNERKKKTNIKVFGLNYKIIRIKKEKIFGIQKLWFEDKPINITEREKAIIDCLDKPQYCGGVIEVFKALNNIKDEEYSKEKLVNYALRMNNSGIARRLGYICDYVGISIGIPKPNARNYLYLDPTMPKQGKPNAKWRLIINLDEKFIGELE